MQHQILLRVRKFYMFCSRQSGLTLLHSLHETLKPILNWERVSSQTYLEVCGEASWFLIGTTFLREPSWKYSSKLYSGAKKLCSTCSGNIRPIQQSLPLIGREQSSPVDEEKIKIKWMTESLGSSLASEGICLFVDLWEAQPCLGDPE